MGSRARKSAAAAVGLALLALGAVAQPAWAHKGHQQPHHNLRGQVLTTAVAAPFGLAVSGKKVYVADGMAGTVTTTSGKTVVSKPGYDVAGVDVSARKKSLAYTFTNGDHTEAGLIITARGKADVVADIAGYEAANNPDGASTYGIVGGSNACAEEILGGLTGGQATYPGIVDAHPYAVANVGSSWLVADAGANAIFLVSRTGKVSTYAVLPPQVITITDDMAAGLEESFGAPAGSFSCLAGVSYAFEPVPTDVEVDRKGTAYVTVLPGGPEDDSLGARGAVYRIGRSGQATKVASGFLGATDLALGSDGTIYVTELYNGRVAAVRGKKVSTAVKIDSPLAVEVTGKKLYVSTMGEIDFSTGEVLSPGSVVKFTLRR